MSNDTITLDEILYKNQAPWLAENASNEKFVSKIHEVKEYVPAFQFKNTIEFERSINAKTKYYTKLIINESIGTINQLHDIITADDNPQIKAYWIDKVLERKLKTRIRDIGTVLKDKDYDLKYIDPKKTTFDIDQNHKSDTYIMQLMKVAFIHIYVELQEVFKDSISDLLIVDDFYTQLLFEPVPDTYYLKEVKVIEVATKPITPKKKQPKPQDIVLTSFTYKQLATNSDKLNDLHDSLKLNHFIAQNTSLTNFKKVFSGKEITAPIEWTGNISELYYFIKLIHAEHKHVNDLKQKQWEVTCLCFVQEGGESFDRTKFRSQKRPNTTGDKLDSIVELLK